MARVYCDEQFPREAAELLRLWGHDVLTCKESRRDNLRIPDPEVLSYAISKERAVLTMDRGDFKRLHRQSSRHFGIVICTVNRNYPELARCVHDCLQTHSELTGKLVRVYKPG